MYEPCKEVESAEDHENDPQEYTNSDRQCFINSEVQQGSDWHHGLFVCHYHCNSLLEACCCSFCQVSRQYNILQNNLPEINFWVILFMLLVPRTEFLLNWHIRTEIRRRFGLKGSYLKDFLITAFCFPCSIQQTHLELTSVGLFPGSCFYAPDVARMV